MQRTKKPERRNILKRFAGPVKLLMCWNVERISGCKNGPCALCRVPFDDDGGEIFSKNVITFQLFEQYNTQYGA